MCFLSSVFSNPINEALSGATSAAEIAAYSGILDTCIFSDSTALKSHSTSQNEFVNVRFLITSH